MDRLAKFGAHLYLSVQTLQRVAVADPILR